MNEQQQVVKEQEVLNTTKEIRMQNGMHILMRDDETNFLLEAEDGDNSLILKGLKFTFNKLPKFNYKVKNNIIEYYNNIIGDSTFTIDLNSFEARIPTTLRLETEDYNHIIFYANRASNVYAKINPSKVNVEVITYHIALINKFLFKDQEMLLNYNYQLFEQFPSSISGSDIIDAYVMLKLKFVN